MGIQSKRKCQEMLSSLADNYPTRSAGRVKISFQKKKSCDKGISIALSPIRFLALLQVDSFPIAAQTQPNNSSLFHTSHYI